MKRTAVVAAALLMGATLSACGDDGGSGGSSGGSYCDQLQDAKDSVNDVDFTALTDATYEDLVSQFQDLEDAAPDDIADDWATLNGALAQFKDILDEAGISLDDLQGMQSGEIPDDVDLDALQQLGTKMQELTASGEFEDASDAISEHALDECDIDLDEGTSTDSQS
jgi:hypothetical protein